LPRHWVKQKSLACSWPEALTQTPRMWRGTLPSLARRWGRCLGQPLPELALALRPEESDEEDQTPESILKFVGDGHQEVVQALLDAGAEVNAQASDCHLTALMVAAMGGEVEIAKTLLAHGADVNLRAGKRPRLSLQPIRKQT
jgi:hypothetical protein